MARTIKIDDEIFEKVMSKKLQEETQIEFVNRIFLFWLKHQKNKTTDEKVENDSDKKMLENFKNRFDDMYENINEILEKVSMNYDKLYGKNGMEEYYIQPQPVARNAYYSTPLSEEEKKKMLEKIRQHPGIIPWDEFDRKMAQARKEIEEEEKKKWEDKE